MSGRSLFDRTAENFARNADTQIEQQRYRRGTLFVAAAAQHVRPGGFILDYGCGPGRIACLLAERGFRVLGVDPSEEMIRKANELRYMLGIGDTAHFGVITGSGNELGTESYEAIVCSSVIEYIAQPQELLQSFMMALRPAGVLIISFANRLSLWRLYAELKSGRSAPHMTLQKNIQRWPKFRKMLVSEGFDVLQGPEFFESLFDECRGLSVLSKSPWMGTLGLVVAKKPGS